MFKKKKGKEVVNIVELAYKYSKFNLEELQKESRNLEIKVQSDGFTTEVMQTAFALCMEVSWKVLGLRHYETQIIAGIALHNGCIAEMQTGEGKTLAATLPIYLNALTHKGVIVITVNDYLAKRDYMLVKNLFKSLGLSIGLITSTSTKEDRKKAYACDILYTTSTELAFDYLRDMREINIDIRVQREFNYIILDEIDSILIDEARNPLVLSKSKDGDLGEYIRAEAFVKGLKGIYLNEYNLSKKNVILQKLDLYEDKTTQYDYVVLERQNIAYLTEQGLLKAENNYTKDGIENKGVLKNINLALKANTLMQKEIDYIIQDDKIIVIDNNTGRLQPGRLYSDGLHQAIEVKEGILHNSEPYILASITYPSLIKQFNKVCGMTGTAKTEDQEFKEVYGLDVIEIPTRLQNMRKDKVDKVYLTKSAKFTKIIDRVLECYNKGQPILVGTVSLKDNKIISDMLDEHKIPHSVLNAENHLLEAEIIASAGKLKAVTVATNMAGRGTDILLGGDAIWDALKEVKKNYSMYTLEELREIVVQKRNTTTQERGINNIYKKYYAELSIQNTKEKVKIEAMGGLYVLGTERYHSRRVDNQLRGRAGRQGDKGTTEFILSLEDDVPRIFGANNVSSLCKTIGIPTNKNIDMGILSKSIAKAQKKVTQRNFDIRKQMYNVDRIVDNQRIMMYTNMEEINRKMSANTITKWEVIEILELFFSTIINESNISNNIDKIRLFIEDMKETVGMQSTETNIEKMFTQSLELLSETNTEKYFITFAKETILIILNNEWQEYLYELEYLKKHMVHIPDPIVYLQNESYRMYEQMQYNAKLEICKVFLESYRKVREEGYFER